MASQNPNSREQQFGRLVNAAWQDTFALVSDPFGANKAIFRKTLLTEIAGRLGDKTAEQVAQRISALKHKVTFPPIPQGERGKHTDREAVAASNAETVANMAAVGFYPAAYDDNGVVMEWTDKAPVVA